MLAHELAPSDKDLDEAIFMTDDRAPLESLLAETSVRWRSQLQRTVPEILLY